jgi:HPt (histidine-containing phosphotransfer) domain-containing protein
MPDIQAGPSSLEADRRPVIETATFRNLASMLGHPRIMRMTASFFADADQRLDGLERNDATCRDLRDHAHALVSMAGHLGLARLSALCMDLQEQARRGEGMDRRPAMRDAVSAARDAITAFIAGGGLSDPYGRASDSDASPSFTPGTEARLPPVDRAGLSGVPA